ncbi:hypothetical protein FQN57_001030 [Myotisia sp. PD_48]|nr:hypothetical protein FQN57_001030 [Myotisia sp. PD_48]
MDAYPLSYVDHNLPLVLLSGIGSTDADSHEKSPEARRDFAVLQTSGFEICCDIPPITGKTASVLLDAFLAEDASQVPWNTRNFNQKSSGARFRIETAGRSYCLPPRKAGPPSSLFVSDDNVASREALTAPLILHSPLSPLTPDSPIFPDGMITPLWISKHQKLIPAASANFFTVTVDPNMASLRDNQLKIEINRLNKEWAISGYKTRFVVCLIFGDGSLSEDLNNRVSSIRRACGLDAKSLFVLWPSPTQQDIKDFVKLLLSTLQGPCIEYYRDLSKHARRKRNRGSIPPPTLPPTTGTSRTLSFQGWNVRYEFKLGVFAEFRQEMDAACRSYQSAYEFLFGEEVFGSTAGWSARFNEARMLGDILALRILRCLLWNEQTTTAVRYWHNHRTLLQKIVDRQGKGTNNYGWEAWEANWSLVMAQLIERANLSAFEIPSNPSKYGSNLVYILPEKEVSSKERLTPVELLHHRGYWLARAAEHTRRRRALAEKIPEEDRLRPESHEPRLNQASKFYDTYMAPEPHDEFAPDTAQHSTQVLRFLDEAVLEFSKRGQTRMLEKLKLDIAKEYVLMASWDKALNVLRPMWTSLSWRREGWWSLMNEVGWPLRECAMHCHDIETVIRVDWELMHKAKPEGNVGEILQAQLLLRSYAQEDAAPIHPIQVEIFFDGGLPPIRIITDEEGLAQRDNSSQSFCYISQEDGLTLKNPLQYPNNFVTLIGEANLSLAPGQLKVFALSFIPRTAGIIHVRSIVLLVEETLFDLRYITNVQSPRGSVWWGRGQRGFVARRIGKNWDASSCNILPKPPKVQVSVPNLQDTYYTGEKMELEIRLDNGEDTPVAITVEVHLRCELANPPTIGWVDTVELDTSHEGTPETATLVADATPRSSGSIKRNIGTLQPAESSTLPAMVINTTEAARYELEIQAVYHLSSDSQTAISKTISLDIPVIDPFVAHYDLLPRLHPQPWPDFFHPDETDPDENNLTGIKGLHQRWVVQAKVQSVAHKSLIIEGISLATVNISGGRVCEISAENLSTRLQKTLPMAILESNFTVDIQRQSIDERQPTALSLSLGVRWRRGDDKSPGRREHPSPASSQLQETISTVLTVPRFVIPICEPRVLASMATSKSQPGLTQVTYTLENPSIHFLTFSLTMEASDQFAFSGPKSLVVQLVPLSRHTVSYNILATQKCTSTSTPAQQTRLDSHSSVSAANYNIHITNITSPLVHILSFLPESQQQTMQAPVAPVGENRAAPRPSRHPTDSNELNSDVNSPLATLENSSNLHGDHPDEAMENGPGNQSLGKASEVICGPLLNYKHMSFDDHGHPIWHGSVLIVTKPGERQPELNLRLVGPTQQNPDNLQDSIDPANIHPTVVQGVKLYGDPDKEFWRLRLCLPLANYEARWEYTIPQFKHANDKGANRSWFFVVPSSEDSMRIMFHSCNGFSLGTDLDHWQGPLLWKDVLRLHEQKPFHVMIGGGDQIYNDAVRTDGPLREWTNIANPHRRRAHLFPNKMRTECDQFYFDNYASWYSKEPFASANSQIPQINIWDDHDIIDGFGSYTDHFMKCAVFRGIGGVAFKYYCLFQHHNAPPMSTFTTDAPQTMNAVHGTAGADPRQLQDSFVYQERHDEPSWIVGVKPGPYVEERSRNLYMRLGKRIAFLGIDARTERTRHQVNYPETYNAIFHRLEQELSAANGDIKHLILLLGVPIAYPRLAWLENLFTSPLIAPIRLLNKRFGLGGDFFNKFDGQVDLLDDLDDHYTARQHKRERRELIQRLQWMSKRFGVRVTILGGDVHLAAVGRFYSRVKKRIPVENDARYMANIISSAITNKPPPKAVANLLARRNKIHHLDRHTDETLMKIFDAQPGGKEKSAAFNKVTMPSRNYACITEVNPVAVNGTSTSGEPSNLSPKNGHQPLQKGEIAAGTTYSSADGVSNTTGMNGGLDISIRVEIDPTDADGKTEGYGFSVPPLIAAANDDIEDPEKWMHRHSLERSR